VAAVVNNSKNYRAVRCNSDIAHGNADRTMNKLRAIDMAIVETVLYLDSYPENKVALNYYQKLISEREKLANELAHNGRPLTSLDAGKHDNWNWINSPWPWEAEANM